MQCTLWLHICMIDAVSLASILAYDHNTFKYISKQKVSISLLVYDFCNIYLSFILKSINMIHYVFMFFLQFYFSRESVELKPAWDYHFVGVSRVDPGTLNTVYLSWDLDYEWYNPGDWPIFDNPELYISYLTVESGEHETRQEQFSSDRGRQALMCLIAEYYQLLIQNCWRQHNPKGIYL